MDFTDLLDTIRAEPLFDTGLLLCGDANPADIRRQLSRWKRTGKIYQLRRGLYCLAPPYQKAHPHPFLVANRLLPASYVSLHSALAYYGMIPEHVPVTTSVTTCRPGRWETPLGVFDYRHIRVGFFDGYQLVDLGGRQQAFIARPEKALLDMVYLEPGADSPDYLTELRLDNLSRLDWHALERLAGRTRKPKLERAMHVLYELAEAEGQFESV